MESQPGDAKNYQVLKLWFLFSNKISQRTVTFLPKLIASLNSSMNYKLKENVELSDKTKKNTQFGNFP